MPSPRLEAALTLRRVLRDNAYSNIELSNTARISGLSHADRALYAAIVRSVLERRLTLDLVLGRYVRKKPDPEVLCCLYTGLAQILFMDKIPQSAACDETVKAAKELTDVRRAGFVNAVLRRACREKETLDTLISGSPDHIKYSISPQICEMLREQYPEDAEEAMARAFSRPPMCLRVNTLRVTPEELVKKLSELGAECEPRGKCVTVFSGAEKLIDGIGGDYFVQGAHSQFAVELLGASEGMNVIDVCACPGGKTLGAAIDMKNKGAVYAFDIHSNKLTLIERSAKALGIDIITTAERDSRDADLTLAGKADRVICDVPCSSLGVLSSKPEIRYKDISSLDQLYKTQYDILRASAAYLKPGGRMVYSTCTFNRNENGVQVRRFLAENPGHALVSEHSFLAEDGYFDGFYAALIERT